MNNKQEHQLKGIIISVNDLNRQVWGSIHQTIEYFYTYGELEDFGLDIYWTNTTNEDPQKSDSKKIVQFSPKNKIELKKSTIRLDPQTIFGIMYNKRDGHDDFDHIASFLMLEKKYSDKVFLGINLNNIEHSVANDYKFRLAAFSCLSNNQSIRILLKDIIIDKETGEEIQIDEQRVLQSGDVARTYLPFCKITESTYDQLFVKQIHEVKEVFDGNKEEQKVIQYVQESIKKIEDDFNKYYLKDFNKRYTTLFDKWFILAYFYSIGIPYTDKRLNNDTTSKTKYTDDNLVAALKTYTNNIQELSQNVINYATDKEGYLYVAFIKKEDISKDILEKNNTFANIDTDVRRFVEFDVMDCAKKGIVQTFTERSGNENEKIELLNFFELNPTKTINLTRLDMRYAAHLGLKTFVASIKGQSGYFYVESNNDNTKTKIELCDGKLEEISSPDFVGGTHFHVVVPVSKIKGLISAPGSQSSAESFIQQFKVILEKGTKIRVSDTDLSSILRLSSSTGIEKRNNEIIKLGDKIVKEKYSVDETSREIAFEIPDNYDSLYIVQNVYRLINYLQLSLNNNYFTTIVLTNLSNEFFYSFWNLFKIHVLTPNLTPIWKNDCAIVLMSKDLNYRIISGEENADIYALNNELKKHYCISTNYPLPEQMTIKKELRYFVRPYELLIGNNKYFYSYLDQLLRKCIEEKEQGYCVRHENTYIGSKMIVVNYYEAETLFQNSFYAERFAFLIAQKLKSTLKAKQIDINENLYIVGAGYYSDLMIKSLQRLLDVHRTKPKTMLVIDDGDKIDFHYTIKPSQESKFVIITPIGSTLSYSDKIAAFIMREFCVNKDNIVHHCVIVVGNKNQNQYEKSHDGFHVFSKGDDGQESDIEYTFRWESIDIKKKQIHLKYKNVEKVDYDILIGQKNEEKDRDNWHHRIDDSITFPNDYAEEKYVNRTENQSINSQNLLGYPKLHNNYQEHSRHQDELKHLKELVQYFYYGHIENHHTHYRYYIHSEEFVAKEKENINSNLSKWMSNLKKDELFQNTEGYLNLIITPNARIESEFVNYINQEVFCHNAQIIYIDAHSWKNNMAHKYKYICDIFKNNNIKIHYVDHALFTANTYLKTKRFLEEVIGREPFEFSSVIVLINRVSPNVTDDIAIKNNFRTFLNLFIPESTDNISDCVLCALAEFYKNFHDKTISSDCDEIIIKNESKIDKTTFEEIKKNNKPIDDKKQLRLLFTHELFFRIASINNNPILLASKRYDLTKEKLDEFYEFEMNVFCKQWSGKTYNPIDQRISFIKVISSPPLTRFIAVREYAHFKLLEILKNLLGKKTEICNIDDLKLLKAVLKSLSFLNSTALVRKTVILDSWQMFNNVFTTEFKELGLDKTDGFNEDVVKRKNEDIDSFVKTNQENLFFQEELTEAKNKKDRLNTLWDTYISFPKELYFNIKNAILEDETKSMFLNELLRTGEECLTIDKLNDSVKKSADFQVMRKEGSKFCDKVNQQYMHFLDWLYYDTTTVLQKALANFEKETLKDYSIKKSFYCDHHAKDYKKWIVADYQTALTKNTIQDFKDKVIGDGKKVEYYYENLKLYNSNAEGIDYIDKLVRVLYAKLKLERLVDSEIDNSQTKVEDDLTDILTVLSDIMKTVRTFIIFKHAEQAYYEFAVGGYGRCGRVDDWEQFVKDFSNINPFGSAKKKIQGDEYYCEYTRIDERSVLYFTYNSETKAPSKAQKQLLLLLRNRLCQYVKFIRDYGLVDVWVEEQRTEEYFKQRFRKNTHNAYGNLQRISSNFFNDEQMTSNPEYVNLYSIIADLHVGRIHNSILVDNEEKYSYKIHDYSIIKERFEHFVECAKQYLSKEGITSVEVENLNGKSFYYTDNLPFLLFQFIHNIKDNTKLGFQTDVRVRIYAEGNYLVISNTHAKIKITDFEHTRELLQSESKNEIPRKSISLYCINHFCKQITGQNLVIDAEENDSKFIVKIPIIKNN